MDKVVRWAGEVEVPEVSVRKRSNTRGSTTWAASGQAEPRGNGVAPVHAEKSVGRLSELPTGRPVDKLNRLHLPFGLSLSTPPGRLEMGKRPLPE
jgi:hypothetical protein